MADMVDGALEARLDTVRRGYDPQQVKRFVSTMAAELRELDQQNAALRAEIEDLRAAASATPDIAATAAAAAAGGVTSSRVTEDIVSSWTRQTAEMLESARQQVERIVEQANVDADAAVAAAEKEADAIRRRAQVEADQLVANAHAHAADAVRAAAAARAADLAASDDRLARQAASDIEETESLLRRAAAWYGEGVQADLRAARQLLETADAMLGRQRYEDAIKTSGEAAVAAQAAYAAATAEAERRRIRRQQEVRRRRLEDSFSRSAGGAGPWVITLPGGRFSGPDPWRSLQAPVSRSAGTGWARDIAQVNW